MSSSPNSSYSEQDKPSTSLPHAREKRMEQPSGAIGYPKMNWTDFIQKRQIFGCKFPPVSSSKVIPTKVQQPSRIVDLSRSKVQLKPLRYYQLRYLVPSTADLHHVFLGFSVCGNYMFSYQERSEGSTRSTFLISNDSQWIRSMVVNSEERSYVFCVWRFIPGKQIKLEFRTNLFDGETFKDPLGIRVEQRPEIPDYFVVIGSLTSNDGGTISKTLWHSIFFIPTASTLCQLTFHSLYGLFSGLNYHDRQLVLCTCDEIVLLDLERLFACTRSIALEKGGWNPQNTTGRRVLKRSLGDISKQTGIRHRFPYSHQTIQWSAAAVGSSDVGLSDYHLFIDALSNVYCDGCIFALFDVDNDGRHYYEAMFTFQWNLWTNKIQLISSKLIDVTDRSKEPGQQQKAFNEHRSTLFSFPRVAQHRYQLSNVSVIEGRSLKEIYDITGFLALTL